MTLRVCIVQILLFYQPEEAIQMADYEIIEGYIPGSIGRIVELHGRYYHSNWEFGAYFEAKVATDLAGFIGRYDDKRDRFWTVAIDDLVAGSLSVDGIHAHTEGAHLRWFIVSEELQGQGIGNQLIRSAIDFCKEKKYPSIYLWTFKGLLSARHLYEKAGFTLVEQCKGCEWGVEVVEQRLVLTL